MAPQNIIPPTAAVVPPPTPSGGDELSGTARNFSGLGSLWWLAIAIIAALGIAGLIWAFFNAERRRKLAKKATQKHTKYLGDDKETAEKDSVHDREPTFPSVGYDYVSARSPTMVSPPQVTMGYYRHSSRVVGYEDDLEDQYVRLIQRQAENQHYTGGRMQMRRVSPHTQIKVVAAAAQCNHSRPKDDIIRGSITPATPNNSSFQRASRLDVEAASYARTLSSAEVSVSVPVSLPKHPRPVRTQRPVVRATGQGPLMMGGQKNQYYTAYHGYCPAAMPKLWREENLLD